MKWKKEALRLYAITDRSWLKSGQTLAVPVELALRGGVSMIQLREKQLTNEKQVWQDLEKMQDLQGSELALDEQLTQQQLRLRDILGIQTLCRQYEVPFIINDDVELARRLQADGVHLGQQDCSIEEARRILGEEAIIGATAKTVEQALAAQIQGANYLGCGAVFGSKTKQEAKPMELALLRQICKTVKIPVVAIGGITADNVSLLAGTGIEGVAVIAGIFAQPDIELAATKLKELVRRVHNE